MGSVIHFVTQQRFAKEPPQDGATAQILPFLGVRYERAEPVRNPVNVIGPSGVPVRRPRRPRPA